MGVPRSGGKSDRTSNAGLDTREGFSQRNAYELLAVCLWVLSALCLLAILVNLSSHDNVQRILALGVSVVSFAAGLLLRARAKRLPQFAAGHCPSCGYDMRQTPDRCPECGYVVCDQPVRQSGHHAIMVRRFYLSFALAVGCCVAFYFLDYVVVRLLLALAIVTFGSTAMILFFSTGDKEEQ